MKPQKIKLFFGILSLLAGCCVLFVACDTPTSSTKKAPLALSYEGSALPAGTVGAQYEQNLGTATGAAGISYALADNSSLPAGLSLSAQGLLAGTPTAAAVGAAFSVTASAVGYISATAAFTITISSNPEIPSLTYTGKTLTAGTVGVAYSEDLATATGAASITYTVTPGTLPPGLDLSAAGLLTGTPSSVATDLVFSVTASAEGYASATVEFTITINAPEGTPALSYTGKTLADGTVGETYSVSLADATGATGINYALTSGSTLPAGLNLSAAGLLAGTPTTVEANAAFSVTASATGYTSATANFSITINVDTMPPTINNPAVTVSNTTATGFTISWVKATDNVTPQNQLVYYIYYNDTGVDPWTLENPSGDVDIDTYTFTGLVAGETRYFKVSVADQEGNESSYTVGSDTTTGNTGIPDKSWYNGSSNFTIYTPDELAGLASLVNDDHYDFSGKTITLGTNIDLTAYASGEGWIPIGNNYQNFLGTFDGDGYAITNLIIARSTSASQGLFNQVGGSFGDGYVKNVKLINVNINVTGLTAHVGGIAGRLFKGSITDSSVTGTINLTGNFTSGIGGIAGESEAAIERCYSTVTVTGNRNVGGIVGDLELLAGKVINCYSTGNVNSTGDYAGGIAGHIGLTSSVANCYATGNVTANDYAGGITGMVDTGCSVTDCAALNQGIEIVGPGANIGCVAGDSSGTLTNNVTSLTSLTSGGANNNLIPADYGTATKNGEFMDKSVLSTDGTIDNRFTIGNGWTIANGSLPGFDAVVPMPSHLQQ